MLLVHNVWHEVFVGYWCVCVRACTRVARARCLVSSSGIFYLILLRQGFSLNQNLIILTTLDG